MTNLTLAFEADVHGVDHRYLEAYDLCQNHIIETPDDLWHDAAEGLATVRAVRQDLREHPKTIRSGKRELGEFEKVLGSASQLGVRFHCYFDV